MFNFFKKTKKDIKVKNTDFIQSPLVEAESVQLMDIPKICSVNLSKESNSCLQKNGYNLYKGSLGSPIQTNNSEPHKGLCCLLNHNIPDNIHEYDVLIIDMTNVDIIPYLPEEHTKKHVDTNNDIYFFSQYPQTLFDPRAFSAYILRNKLDRMIAEQEILVIIFASELTETEYNIVEKNSYQVDFKERKKLINYSYFSSLPYTQNKIGTEIKFRTKNPELHRIVSKYDFKYNIIFEHPLELKNGGRFHGNAPDPLFEPLMYNKDNEIISYHHLIGKSNIFVFPELSNKTDFISEFLSDYAPIVAPNLFPFSSNFLWRKNKEYNLPNHEKLIFEKNQIEDEYRIKIENKNKEIDVNLLKYKFLHDILTETGDTLVKATIDYLRWLGFSDVKDVDKEKAELFEEDLQIETNKGLLLVEVKGIGGTSTDSQCSQIAKNIQRRMKELNRTDVYGLYLVNNERYKPPINRTCPPFDNQKIEDAKSGQRGLLTTWQMFSLFSLISLGLITKEEARNKFTDYGLIEFTPKFNSIIEINKIYRREQTTIVSINIVNQKISQGDIVFVLKNNTYSKHEIISIQANKKQVNDVENGTVGLMLNGIVKQKSQICIR